MQPSTLEPAPLRAPGGRGTSGVLMTPARAEAPLRVSIRDGERLVSFPGRELWGWVSLERFEVRAPLTPPAERLRHARAHLSALSASLRLLDLERLLRDRLAAGAVESSAPSEFPEVHLRAAGTSLVCWGIHQPRGARPTPFYFEAALHPAPQSLRVDCFRGWVLGLSAPTASQLAARLLREALLPTLPSHPSALQLDPLTELSLAVCLDYACKLPARSAATSVRAEGGALRVEVEEEAAPYTPSGPYAEHLRRLKRFSEGEQLIYRGELASALSFYRATEPHPFATQRALELARVLPMSPEARVELDRWLGGRLTSGAPLLRLSEAWRLEREWGP